MLHTAPESSPELGYLDFPECLDLTAGLDLTGYPGSTADPDFLVYLDLTAGLDFLVCLDSTAVPVQMAVPVQTAVPVRMAVLVQTAVPVQTPLLMTAPALSHSFLLLPVQPLLLPLYWKLLMQIHLTV